MQGPGAPLHLWPGTPSVCRLYLDVGAPRGLFGNPEKGIIPLFLGGKKGYLIRVALT